MFLLPEIASSLILLCFVYWCLPKYLTGTESYLIQNWLLLLYSVGLFACLAPKFLALLLVYSGFALVLRKWTGTSQLNRKLLSTLLVFGAVAMLVLVKYYNPTREFLINELPQFEVPAPIDLVLGFSLSFLTFQFITLVVFWYQGKLSRDARSLDVVLYICFFAPLAAGPITRASQLLPQFARPRQLIAFRIALMRILLGVWQMLVCAQWLADTWVNPIYASPDTHHALEVIAAIAAYSLQIYLDFSGLSNIVIGLGWLLGIRLPRNFRSPYLALNIRDFWRRWHISLSTWIRDYIYKPLGGNRKGFAYAQLAVMISMGLSGIWHGAALTYIVWAGLHICAVVTLNCLDALKIRINLPTFLRVALTFIWVSIAWVFFRADSVTHALLILDSTSNGAALIQYNVLGFALLLGLFFYALYNGPTLSQTMSMYLKRLPAWAFAMFVILSTVLAIELGPTGVPNFIYAGF